MRENKTAFTPGFFATRSVRNTSQGSASKTYENYLRARENAEKVAKEKVDRLNYLALKKANFKKIAEKKSKETG